MLVYIQPEGDLVTPTTLCPGDTLSFNCSLWKYTWNPRLQWHVTYPEQEPVIISYSSTSYRNRPKHYGLSIISALTKIKTSSAPYMASDITLLVVRGVSIHGTEVRCTISGMAPVRVKIKHKSLNQGIVTVAGLPLGCSYVIRL